MSRDRKLYKIVMGITILIIGIIGVEWNNILNFKPLIKHQILSNLEEKYEEEFEAIDSELSYSEEYGYNLKVCAKNKENSKYSFDAYKKKNSNGKYEYIDSYLGVLLKDDYESKVNSIAQKYYKDFKNVINYTSEPFSNEYDNKNIDFEELEYNPPISIRVSPTFNDIEEFESNTNLFIEEMKKNNICGSVTVMYLNSDEYLDNEILDSTMYQKRNRFHIENE